MARHHQVLLTLPPVGGPRGGPAPDIGRDQGQTAGEALGGAPPSAVLLCRNPCVACGHVSLWVQTWATCHPDCSLWPPLTPKGTRAGDHAHRQEGVFTVQALGCSGWGLWSPSSQSMAWKRERGHTHWALWAARPTGTGAARGEGTQPGSEDSSALRNKVLPQPTAGRSQSPPSWDCSVS